MTKMQPMTGAGFLSVAETAKFLDVSERVIRKLIRDGLLQSYRVGRCIRIAEPQLVAFLEKAQMMSRYAH
jgi:excisionase family DNA binding protein